MDAKTRKVSTAMRRQAVRMKHLIASMQRLTAVSCATGLAMTRFNSILREAAYWEGIKARDPEGFRRAHGRGVRPGAHPMNGMGISAASRQPGHPRYEHELETHHLTARETEDDGTYYWCRDCDWQHFEPKERAPDD